MGVLLAGSPAWALVGKGARAGDFTVEDTEGAAVRFSTFTGRAILVMYEDRVAVDWNAALKKRLSRDKSLPRTLVVLPVADMRRWKFWPARTFAQKELRKRSKEMGRRLFGDWNGEAAKALGVADRTSSVVLFGEDGLVRWAGSGRLSAERIDELVALIRWTPQDDKDRPKDAAPQAAAPQAAAESPAPPAPEPAVEPSPEPLPEPLPEPSRAAPSAGSTGPETPR
jgi:hypothetical protein